MLALALQLIRAARSAAASASAASARIAAARIVLFPAAVHVIPARLMSRWWSPGTPSLQEQRPYQDHDKDQEAPMQQVVREVPKV